MAAVTTRTPTDVFDALRQHHFDQGILTEFGRDQGCVAFQPSPFFGRFLGEIAYSLNDALRRLEGNTSYYVMSGDGDTLPELLPGTGGRPGGNRQEPGRHHRLLPAEGGVRWNGSLIRPFEEGTPWDALVDSITITSRNLRGRRTIITKQFNVRKRSFSLLPMTCRKLAWSLGILLHNLPYNQRCV